MPEALLREASVSRCRSVWAGQRTGAANARRAASVAGVLAACALLSSRTALAADVEVHGDTAFQAYEITGPWGDVVLERRRLMQTLGLGVYNLQGDYKPGEAEWSIVLKMRLDADFGVNNHLQGGTGSETNYGAGPRPGEHYVPGLEAYPIDLMYGWIEGRNLAGGWLGIRAGRQYISDVLGWWSFDGGLLRVTTPFYVQAEVYGGLEQRGGLPLSTPRYERQGVWRGSHGDFGGADQPVAGDYPSYLYAQPAPAFGAALESNGPSFVHGRFDYRRVYNTGNALTGQFPGPGGGYQAARGTRLSQERLGYAADLNKSDLGGIKGGFAYDLLSQLMGNFYGGIEAYLGSRVTLGADIDYFEPTFDGDSIWNWFSKSPITTVTGRFAVDITPELDVAGSGGVRLWTTDGDPDSWADGQCEAAGLPVNAAGENCFEYGAFVDPLATNVAAFTRDEANRGASSATDVILNLAGRYRWPSARVGLRGMLQSGTTGRRTGADLDGEKKLDGGRYTLGGRVSVYDWNDPLRPPEREGDTSFAYVLAGGWRPAELADLRVEFEHDMNALAGQRFRVVGLLNLNWGTK
jgi:hypothetical protein